MWYDTRVTRLLGIQYPILLGPFGGGLSTVRLASTVSNLGGLGGYGVYTLSPEEIVKVNTELRLATDKPYNLNLWVSNADAPREGIADARYERVKAVLAPYFQELGVDFPPKPTSRFSAFEDQAQVILDLRPPLFSFIFGIPSADILEACRKRGILTAGGATTLDEALALEAAGVDLVVASGFESGGHRPSFLAPAESSLVGTFVLVQQIRERIRTPVIAAGGVATGRGIAAALTLGAEAVQVGTAFLACEESGAPAFHRDLLFSPSSRHTVLTRTFTGRLGRGIANRLSEEVRETLPFPLQSALLSPLRRAAIEHRKWDLVLAWGGQIAPLLTHRKAADLMAALISETNAIQTPNYER